MYQPGFSQENDYPIIPGKKSLIQELEAGTNFGKAGW
jgi:hypothetical protein